MDLLRDGADPRLTEVIRSGHALDADADDGDRRAPLPRRDVGEALGGEKRRQADQIR